jgi:Transposase DDE domain group 1
MSNDKALIEIHPQGEPQIEGNPPPETSLSLDTCAGKVQFR